MKPEQSLAWMHDGTQRILADIDGLSDAALGRPTALPGWTRRHLLSHLAANADALGNLAHWARTGEERRMYASAQDRQAGIAAGTTLPPRALRDRVTASAATLATALSELADGPAGEAAWNAKIITAQGLTRPASEIPWMRAREVYIHAIDLGAGATFADLPPDFLTALLDEATAHRTAAGGGPALALAATDTGHTWEVAGTGSPVPVSAPLTELAAYLTGRPAPELRAAPALPPWL